jgi:hypothetical protein
MRFLFGFSLVASGVGLPVFTISRASLATWMSGN